MAGFSLLLFVAGAFLLATVFFPAHKTVRATAAVTLGCAIGFGTYHCLAMPVITESYRDPGNLVIFVLIARAYLAVALVELVVFLDFDRWMKRRPKLRRIVEWPE
jgi:hypothetical protein